MAEKNFQKFSGGAAVVGKLATIASLYAKNQ
jgi:hypothetical protein